MRVPFIFNVKNTDTSYIQDGLGHIRIPLGQTYTLPGKPSDWHVVLEYLSIPYTCPNISAAKSNNKLRYTYSGSNFDITIPDGIYTTTQLTSVINEAQESQTHYYTDASGEKQYYFNLLWNESLSKSYFQLNDASTYPITITFPTSTFYEVIGFEATDSINSTTLSTNKVDITQSTETFFLWSDFVKGNYNANIGNSRFLYTSTWNNSAFAYNQFPNVSETGNSIIADISKTSFDAFEFKLLDKNGAVLPFDTTADSDSLTIRMTFSNE